MFGPNITGTILAGGNHGNEPEYFTGAFVRTGYGLAKTWGSEADREYCNNTADFQAGRSSGVYGNSSTVKPPAMSALVLIKF